MQETKEKINLICTIDESYVPHCAAMLASVLANTSADLDIIIIHDGVSHVRLSKLTGFVTSKGHKVADILCDNSILGDAPISNHVSLATYYRLLIPALVPEDWEKALFIDCDIIVNGDIAELYETDVAGYPLAAVYHGKPNQGLIDNLQFDKNDDYFNAGVMLIDIAYWRHFNLTRKSLKFISENAKHLKHWDQDVLNYFFRRTWLKVDPAWNVMQYFYFEDKASLNARGYRDEEISNALTRPKIVHFTGDVKPWNISSVHPLWESYFHYLEKSRFGISEVLTPKGWKTLLRFYIKKWLRNFCLVTNQPRL